MKLAYFGGDLLYPCFEAILAAGHDIIAVYCESYAPDEADMSVFVKERAAHYDIPIKEHKPTIDDMALLSEMGCDMLLAAGYHAKIPPWKEHGISYAVNIHPSMLPLGAGPAPLHGAILRGETSSGVTLHHVTDEWDAGDIILQEAFDITDNATLHQLTQRSRQSAVTLLNEFLTNPKEYWDNATPQTRGDGDYWSVPTAQELMPDWTRPAEHIARIIRTHRFVTIDNRVEYADEVRHWQQEHNLAPGMLIEESDARRTFATTDGFIQFSLVSQPYFAACSV